jgi:hypothetical protein
MLKEEVENGGMREGGPRAATTALGVGSLSST